MAFAYDVDNSYPFYAFDFFLSSKEKPASVAFIPIEPAKNSDCRYYPGSKSYSYWISKAE